MWLWPLAILIGFPIAEYLADVLVTASTPWGQPSSGVSSQGS